MSNDVFANFACLDELTQVIYQGAYRFVVLSAVSDQWTIYLGLSGPEGRWWRGSWNETKVLEIAGSKSSDKILEAFAEKLAETFIQGELHVGDWTSEKGAEIKLTLGPSSKKPLHVSLAEITSAEAASHATDVFLDIALQAQSRKCRLHPDEFSSTYVSSARTDRDRPTTTKSTTGNVTASDSSRTGASSRQVVPLPQRAAQSDDVKAAAASKPDNAQSEIKALKAELAKHQQRAPSTDPKPKSAPPAKTIKGASLANPNKKARKYQAIEFGSDED
ncbi:hypothetical protein H0H92_007726 [Tricholoma furcatifolium]|nr:hypothetical protein H0H92_007726 [Tricholoma furcatifolium]